MIGIIGIIIIFAMVFGGYLAAGGHMDIIMKSLPYEMMIIGGAALAALRPLFPSIQQMADVVMGRPLFLSTGVFFTAEMLPSSVREILLYNPLLHIIEMLRTAFFVEFESRYADPDYALTWATAVLAVGLLIHRALRRQVLKK